jgi:hypothetical protein
VKTKIDLWGLVGYTSRARSNVGVPEVASLRMTCEHGCVEDCL